jgi:hypothetical protein
MPKIEISKMIEMSAESNHNFYYDTMRKTLRRQITHVQEKTQEAIMSL